MAENRDFGKDKLTEKEFNKLTSEEKILKFSSGYKTPEGMSKDEALNKLMQNIEKGVKIKPISTARSNRYLIWSAAAVLIVLIGLFFVWSRAGNVKVITTKGEHIEFTAL